ncbi:MAG: hypothetical protein LKI26_00925 [Bifidobacterium tibiigranuli]|jgi:hypothetical protein|uniref:hypothetical protein n=1 Tax=Bifidobacterium tibiigranuli TaxID=2172043 RepID=UPI0026ED7C72|nr:hypothetical protein [Bifidobacterium tibiigranuli]MCI1649197.1 hypothetical protein [Bifidobacterium tibiigranuli]MCI2185615.1 hypothetical protein [Bifidobacterium tibiigranuli]
MEQTFGKVSDLLTSVSSELANSELRQSHYEKPEFPLCVCYLGQASARYNEELQQDIAGVWGPNMDAAVFLTALDPQLSQIRNETTHQALDAQGVRDALTGLLSAGSSYDNASHFFLLCLCDVSEITSQADMQQWIASIATIQHIVEQPTRTMLMLVLNEDLNHRSSTKDIRQELLSLDENHAMDSIGSTMLLSNRLANGKMLRIDPDAPSYHDFNLLADVVLAANTAKLKLPLFDGQNRYFSAAYAFADKPVRQIASICLDALMQQLTQLQAGTAAKEIATDELKSALKTTDHRSAGDIAVERGRSQFPAPAFVRHLPGSVDESMGYDEATDASLGCLEAFVNEQFIAKITAKDISSGCQTAWKRFTNTFPAARLKNGLTEEQIKVALSAGAYSANAAREDSSTLMRDIEAHVAADVNARCNAQLRARLETVQEKAAKVYDAFNELSSEAHKHASRGDTGLMLNLVEYYSQQVEAYYRGTQDLNVLASRIFNIENTKDDMLDMLQQELTQMFDSAGEVFKLNFAQELQARLGMEKLTGTNPVVRELTTANNDKVCFYSDSPSFPPDPRAKAFFLNSHNKSLRQAIDARKQSESIPQSFFDIDSNDRAESVWFYALEQENLKS